MNTFSDMSACEQSRSSSGASGSVEDIMSAAALDSIVLVYVLCSTLLLILQRCENVKLITKQEQSLR